MKVFVTAKPDNYEDKIEQIDNSHFCISVKAPPIKGRANLAIKKVLADYFKIAPSQINLIKGYSSRYKVFEIK